MIEVKNVSKNYKILDREPGLKGAIKALFKSKYYIKQAVKSLDFSIEKGEIVGYIGANGAGKSTTIKMISGILTPDTGEITVNGIVPYENRIQNAKNIGAVFGQRSQLYWDIPVRESFDLIKHIYEIPEDVFEKNISVFTEILDLQELLGLPVRQLSLGQKMRCELATAFLHNPPVVYLDEPTIGLDVSVKRKIRSFIKEMNRVQKNTIILTTHDMQDIEELCNRILIIDNGTVIYDGSLSNLKKQTQYNRVIHLEFEEGFKKFKKPVALEGKVLINDNEKNISIHYHSSKISSGAIMVEIMNEYAVKDFTITEQDIELVIQDIYSRGGSVCENIGNC
ncbi:ABC transporter ATP-binding protein [Bacillus cereus]|uniref:ABC transporter ATP-binding protein n=1 Tax=Bacillus cereus TaxID=1396 RepID=UPI00384E68A6